MRYVALLSGGKDSCFNLVHCAQNGHQLVAAASLGPGPGKDEIDSYLYQTVGQDAIQLVADALEVPLLRRIITGEAVQQGSEYGSRHSFEPQGVQGDETEDLFELLLEVKTKFPEVQGVSVGAILSNYQRVRVENVCQRVSLTPLCYLWQRDQAELLAEMIGSGLEAVLIKVAGIGLTIKHLGKTLVEMQPTLLKLSSMYGAHVCGEGGEYESLTLDLPLFKNRIIIEHVETVIHSDNDFATVAYLKVKRARLEKKPSSHTRLAILSPPTFRDMDERVSQAVLSAESSPSPVLQVTAPHMYQYWNTERVLPRSRRAGPWVVISNVESTGSGASVEDEVRSCFEDVRDHLARHSLGLSNIANIILLLSSMELFPIVNSVYASFFGVSPPARACIAVDLPSSIRLRLECIAYSESLPHERQSLHVQSLSYWAPANIGPYSQAITVGGRVFVSGQIGLVPCNNTLPSPQSLSREVALSIRHIRSIANVVKHSSAACWDGVTQGAIFWLAHASHLVPTQRGIMTADPFRPGVAPTLFVAVKSLPKAALVESQVLLHIARNGLSEEAEDEAQCLVPKFSSGELPGLQAHWEASYFVEINSFLVMVACMSHNDEFMIGNQLSNTPELRKLWQNTASVRLFHTPTSAPNVSRLLCCLFESSDNIPPLMAIPSRVIATWERNDWDYALCFIR